MVAVDNVVGSVVDSHVVVGIDHVVDTTVTITAVDTVVTITADDTVVTHAVDTAVDAAVDHVKTVGGTGARVGPMSRV